MQADNIFDVTSPVNGYPCLKHNCRYCCFDTEMNLTREDIIRIEDAGYKTKDFVVTKKGENYLKNFNRQCFFLTNSGCSIHHLKPEGCRLYPLVYDEENNSIFLDPLCPHKSEFKIGKQDIKNMLKILKKLYEEKL